MKIRSEFFKIIFVLILVVSSAAHAEETETQGQTALELISNMELPSGWSREGEPAVYHADNLWEYINGSAEKFLSYDFKEAAVQNLTAGGENELMVEVYRHGNDKMAYGIYSQFSRGKENEEGVGDMSFSGDYSLHFWKGDFYVKVSVYEKSEFLSGAMKKFAIALAGDIKKSGTKPEQIAWLPEEGMDQGSAGFIAEGVLGSGALPPAATAGYSFGGENGKLYLFSFKTAEESADLLNQLSEKLEGEPTRAEGDGPGRRRVTGTMKYRGRVMLFKYGRMAGVITGFEDSPEAAVKLEESVVKKFSEKCE
ncbi:MAG: DUF6599 family protein [Candidatus Krumholzibacteriales bacterium]